MVKSKLEKHTIHYEDNADKFAPSSTAGKEKAWPPRPLRFAYIYTYNFVIDFTDAIKYIFRRVI